MCKFAFVDGAGYSVKEPWQGSIEEGVKKAGIVLACSNVANEFAFSSQNRTESFTVRVVNSEGCSWNNLPRKMAEQGLAPAFLREVIPILTELKWLVVRNGRPIVLITPVCSYEYEKYPAIFLRQNKGVFIDLMPPTLFKDKNNKFSVENISLVVVTESLEQEKEKTA